MFGWIWIVGVWVVFDFEVIEWIGLCEEDWFVFEDVGIYCLVGLVVFYGIGIVD